VFSLYKQKPAYEIYSPPQEQHQNLPTINNLINPPQNDGTAQSKPNMGQSEPENGLASHPEASQQLPQAQVVPQPAQIRQTKGKYSLTDFDMLRTLGTEALEGYIWSSQSTINDSMR